MVKGNGLENRRARKGSVGSNPPFRQLCGDFNFEKKVSERERRGRKMCPNKNVPAQLYSGLFLILSLLSD